MWLGQEIFSTSEAHDSLTTKRAESVPCLREGINRQSKTLQLFVIAEGFQIICGAVQAYSADVIDSLLNAFCPDQLSVWFVGNFCGGPFFLSDSLPISIVDVQH